jgi:hypothetical protein
VVFTLPHELALLALANKKVIYNNSPGPEGIDLTLLRLEIRDGKTRLNYIGNASTDRGGEYSFTGIAPGQYNVALNLRHLPTPDAPYPTIYWPNTRTEAEAHPATVTDSAPARHDFKLPPEPKSYVVHGTVLLPDGRPAEGVRVIVQAVANGAIAADKFVTEDDGAFSFVAFEGFEYIVDAAIWSVPGKSVHSAKVRVSGANGTNRLTLILDRPGRFDNDPVEKLNVERLQR